MSVRKIALMPLAKAYGMAVWLHNAQYDWGLRRKVSFSLPVVAIGNLAVGGTGKTPLVIYCAQLLAQHMPTAILSRGYGRRGGSFRWVHPDDSFVQVGDEPLLMKRKLPKVAVAVCADRVVGISLLAAEDPHLGCVLLDDAFQHRQVAPGLSLLLTSYSRPFWKDHLMPAGRLREPPDAAKRAHAVIVTKCPSELRHEERIHFCKEVERYGVGTVFFTALHYEKPCVWAGPDRAFPPDGPVLAVTGIADPDPFIRHVAGACERVEHKRFADHHVFTAAEVRRLIRKAKTLSAHQPCVVTTEKDAVRLLPYNHYFVEEETTLFCIPVSPIEIAGSGPTLKQYILQFLHECTNQT